MDIISVIQTIFWIIFGIDCIWMTVIGHHWYIYWLNQKESFFYKRMSTTTLILAVYLYMLIIHRIYYAATGLGYLPYIWEFYRLFSYLTSYPFQALFFYKSVLLFHFLFLLIVCTSRQVLAVCCLSFFFWSLRIESIFFFFVTVC